MNNVRHLLPLLLISIVALTTSIATAADKHPNIVIILTDDFGVGNIQAHYPNNKITTPHLDRLVQQTMFSSRTTLHLTGASKPSATKLLLDPLPWDQSADC